MAFGTRIRVVGFRTLRFALRLLPTRCMLAVGAALGGLAARWCPRELRLAAAQQRAAGLPGDAESRARAVFRHVGEIVAEMMIVPRLCRGERVHVRGLEIPEALHEQGQGALCLSGHLGCFELLAAWHARRGFRLSAVGRQPNYAWLDELHREFRNEHTVHTIWREEPEAAKKLLRAIRQGHIIAALIDQDTDLPSGFAPFFGIDAASPIALVDLAVRLRIPILTSFIVRTSRGRHEIRTERLDYDPAAKDAAARILATFNARLEERIRAHPEQWIWWHRRWRRRPGVDYRRDPSALRSTRAYLEWLESLRDPAAAR